MKRLLTVLLSALFLVTGSALFAACDKESARVSVYMPDGAPALAMAQLMSEEMQFGGEVSYNVVDSTAIQTYVGGDDPQADVCVLPVNLAAQTMGSGSVYRMLGTVTHGNIYFLSSKHPDAALTAENLADLLVGRTVGCIQLNNVVGLTLRLVLAQNDVDYAVIEDVSQAAADKVNILNIADPASGITPAAEYDYMVAAEPVVTTKVNATASNAEGMRLVNVGDLQALYGEGGYPQAVLVAKTSLIESQPAFIESLIEAVKANADWVKAETTSVESIVAAVSAHLPSGAKGTLTVQNLNKDVIGRCAVRFAAAAECKEEVNAFLAALSQAAGKTFSVSDAFFYEG